MGFAIFEVTNWKPIFFLAPNIFENFYLIGGIVNKWYKDYKFTAKRLIAWLVVAAAPKIVQEYLMHFKYPDQTWNFMRDRLFWWMYD